MNKVLSTPPEQPAPCPRCTSVAHVRRKLITFVRDWSYAVRPTDPSHGHITVSSPDAPTSDEHSGSFLNGFYCDTCGIGFVPDAVLREVGLSEREILSARIFAPDPIDRYGP